MANWLLGILDWVMLLFHAVFILFILFGWIFVRLRRIHIASVLLTGASWFLLGLFLGFGYCPFTDWHWKILGQLGETGLPVSYVQYFSGRVAGISMTPDFADGITLMGWFMALTASVYVNLRNDRWMR